MFGFRFFSFFLSRSFFSQPSCTVTTNNRLHCRLLPSIRSWQLNLHRLRGGVKWAIIIIIKQGLYIYIERERERERTCASTLSTSPAVADQSLSHCQNIDLLEQAAVTKGRLQGICGVHPSQERKLVSTLPPVEGWARPRAVLRALTLVSDGGF